MFVKRNSGATLTSVIYKRGGSKERAQGEKMRRYPDIFAPILLLADDGYIMPELKECCATARALERLRRLWYRPQGTRPDSGPTRAEHHMAQVAPLVTPTLMAPLELWRSKAATTPGQAVNVVHGDATLENIMMTQEGCVVWIDPSVRAMPLEAEFDVGKLLQSYFGYGEGATAEAKADIRRFIHEESLNYDLLGYYLVTHLVRLHVVQPQARRWAERLACTLEQDMEELCKLSS